MLFWGLAGASLIMTMHAGYLMLMSYHLVYRFPIERIQLIGLVMLPITSAYVLHAVHDYRLEHESSGFNYEVLSAGAFTLSYLLMAAHGLHHYVKHRHSTNTTVSLAHQPNRQRRQSWMLRTDLALCGLALLVFFEALHCLPFGLPPRPSLALPEGPFSWLALTLLRKGSLEDALILAALLLYAVVKYRARKQFEREKGQRHREVQALQKLEFIKRLEENRWGSLDPAQFQSALPQEPKWLDVGNLQGALVDEIVRHIYPADTDGAPAVVFLHQDDIRSVDAIEKVRTCNVIHMAHTAYTVTAARNVVRLLRYSQIGTRFIVRFTADASLYRAISSATACAPLFPYTYHAVHPLLLKDLEDRGWKQSWRALMARQCEIAEPRHVQSTIDWCDAQYGEFSGEVIGRYLKGFVDCGYKGVINSDLLVLLIKT